MGVAGSGKSTIAALLAESLHLPFLEGDDLHSPENVAKMAGGHALDDRDRAPWLDRVNGWMRGHAGDGVVSCSALALRYRDRLRAGIFPPPLFVFLDPPVAELERRLAARRDHFMPPGLLHSQLTALERPSPSEDAICITRTPDAHAICAAVMQWLQEHR